MVLFALLMALWSGWLGARAGAWFGALNRQTQITAPVSRRAAWVGIGALSALATCTVVLL